MNLDGHAALAGQRVVVTQRRDLAQPLAAGLQAQGAEVLLVPATRFRPPRDLAPLQQAATGLLRYDWVVFSNPCGFDFFVELCAQGQGGWERLREVRLATCGPQTADRLREKGLCPAAVAADHKTPLIAEALARAGGIAGQRVLLLRGEETLGLLSAALREMGGAIDAVASFGTEPEREDATGDAARWRRSGADWLVFSSGLAIEHFDVRFDLAAVRRRWRGLRVALASASIRSALEERGLKATVVAQPADNADLIRRLVAAVAAPR